MPFADDVRDELCRALPAEGHCRLALLAAIVRTAGSLHLRGRGEVHVEVDLGTNAAARRTVEALRGLGGTCEIRSYRAPRFRERQRFLIVFGSDPRTLQVLHEAGVLGASLAPLAVLPSRVVARACCRGAYLRGAFIAAGSVAAPRRPAHLEIRAHDAEGAALLARLARADGLALGVVDRGDHVAAYAKRLETIADLLARMGAGEAALLMAEAEVLARAKEAANREANCDAANLRRQVESARRQLAAIETLEQQGRLAALAAPLVAAADLRRAHPGATLAELAAEADPPLAKPTLAARLRRLEHLAADGD